MKYKKIIIATLVVTTVVITAVSFNFSSILMGLAGHSMKNSEQMSMSTSHSTHNPDDKSAILNNLEITKKPSSTISTDVVPNINTPPRKKEPDLTNVVFIDYVVNPIDTLWGIARIYMPKFPDYDTADSIGIITYIAEMNNISKGTDGNYVIYYGQKLKIPAQLSIVSNVIKQSNKNTTIASKTTVIASSKKSSNTTNSTVSKNNISNTLSTSTTNPPTSSNSNENLPTSQTDQSSHNSH